MPNTSNFALTYPASGDHTRLWEHFQELAEDTDTALDNVNTVVMRKVKAADESVTSSTTAQNDDDLFVAVEANTNYVFDAYLNFVGDAAGDAKFGFTYPTGSEVDWGFHSVDTSTALAIAALQAPASGTTVSIGVAGTATYRPTYVKGSLFVGGTAGDFRLVWAQNASNATATVLKKGSNLVVAKCV